MILMNLSDTSIQRLKLLSMFIQEAIHISRFYRDVSMKFEDGRLDIL